MGGNQRNITSHVETRKIETKTEQSWKGRNRRRLEETLGGEEGGGEDRHEASRTFPEEGRCKEGGGVKAAAS
jgi:hypothetical protein